MITELMIMAICAVAPANKTQTAADSVVIDKQTMTLTAWRGGSPVASFGVAVGRNPGNKVKPGDMRTPEGRFKISEIVDSRSWTHDFGQGEVEGAYGPWFMRLATPGHRGIGIHGTHDPASIGTRVSEGCIRLSNEHCDSLRRMVKVGTPVIIRPGQADIAANKKR